MDEARHLVARAAQAPLGALERERRLARDELGEAGRLRDVGAAGPPPALAQLGDRRRLAGDDAAAVGLAAEQPAPGAARPGSRGSPKASRSREPARADAVALRRAARRRAAAPAAGRRRRRGGLEARVERGAAPAAARRRNRDRPRRGDAGRACCSAIHSLRAAAARAARGVEQEDDAPPVASARAPAADAASASRAAPSAADTTPIACAQVEAPAAGPARPGDAILARRVPLYAELTREIDEGPAGPQVGAFFDLDRTLLAGLLGASPSSATRCSAAGWARAAWRRARSSARCASSSGRLGFSGFIAETAALLRGVAESAHRWRSASASSPSTSPPTIYPESRALVQAHRRKGHTVAVVSSATRYQIEPLARDLGIAHVLCTRLEVARRPLHRRASCGRRATATARLAAARDARRRRTASTSDQSYFYTDSDEDLPLLEIVGRPRPTNPNRRLAAIAAAARLAGARASRSRGTPGALRGRCAPRSPSAASCRRCSLGLPAAALRAAAGARRSTSRPPPGASSAPRSPASSVDVTRRGAPLVAPAGGLHLQPPERRRHAAALQAAAPRLRRHRQAGGAAQSDLRPGVRARRHRLHRPLQPRAGDRGAASRPSTRSRRGSRS